MQSFQKIYVFNASLLLFQQKLNGSNVSMEAVQNAFGRYVILVYNVLPWQGTKLLVMGIYNSSIATPQGKRKAHYFIDLGIQKK